MHTYIGFMVNKVVGVVQYRHVGTGKGSVSNVWVEVALFSLVKCCFKTCCSHSSVAVICAHPLPFLPDYATSAVKDNKAATENKSICSKANHWELIATLPCPTISVE